MSNVVLDLQSGVLSFKEKAALRQVIKERLGLDVSFGVNRSTRCVVIDDYNGAGEGSSSPLQAMLANSDSAPTHRKKDRQQQAKTKAPLMDWELRSKVATAARLGIPVITEQYLCDSLHSGKLLDLDASDEYTVVLYREPEPAQQDQPATTYDASWVRESTRDADVEKQEKDDGEASTVSVDNWCSERAVLLRRVAYRRKSTDATLKLFSCRPSMAQIARGQRTELFAVEWSSDGSTTENSFIVFHDALAAINAFDEKHSGIVSAGGFVAVIDAPPQQSSDREGALFTVEALHAANAIQSESTSFIDKLCSKHGLHWVKHLPTIVELDTLRVLCEATALELRERAKTVGGTEEGEEQRWQGLALLPKLRDYVTQHADNASLSFEDVRVLSHVRRVCAMLRDKKQFAGGCAVFSSHVLRRFDMVDNDRRKSINSQLPPLLQSFDHVLTEQEKAGEQQHIDDATLIHPKDVSLVAITREAEFSFSQFAQRSDGNFTTDEISSLLVALVPLGQLETVLAHGFAEEAIGKVRFFASQTLIGVLSLLTAAEAEGDECGAKYCAVVCEVVLGRARLSEEDELAGGNLFTPELTGSPLPIPFQFDSVQALGGRHGSYFILKNQTIQTVKVRYAVLRSRHLQSPSQLPTTKIELLSKPTISSSTTTSAPQPQARSERDEGVKRFFAEVQGTEVRSTVMKARIVDVAAEVYMLQEVVNPTNTHLRDSSFRLSLPRGCAVFHFEAYFRGKVVKGVVKEKEKAQKEFQQAVEAGERAYLVTREKETEDSTEFSIALGRIAPRAIVVLKIGFVMQLPVVAGTHISFKFPVPVERIDECEVAVEMPFDILSLRCGANNTAVMKRSLRQAALRIGPSCRSEGIELDIELDTPLAPRLWVETAPSQSGRDRAAMLVLTTDETMSLTPSKKAAVKERSAAGPSFGCVVDPGYDEAMWSALTSFIGSLPPSSHCTVLLNTREVVSAAPRPIPAKEMCAVMGSSTVRSWREVPHEAQAADLAATLKFLLGAQPMAHVVYFHRSTSAAPGDVYDGSLQITLTQLRKRGFFTFSVVMTDVSHQLRALAHQFGGVHVPLSRKNSPVAEVMRTVPPTLADRTLSAIGVDWSLESNAVARARANSAVHQAPRQVPSLSQKSLTTVYGVLSNDVPAIRVSGLHTLHGEYDSVVAASISSQTSGKVIHRLATVEMLHDHENNQWCSSPAADLVAKAGAESFLTEACIANQIISKFTSMVAVDNDSTEYAAVAPAVVVAATDADLLGAVASSVSVLNEQTFGGSWAPVTKMAFQRGNLMPQSREEDGMEPEKMFSSARFVGPGDDVAPAAHPLGECGNEPSRGPPPCGDPTDNMLGVPTTGEGKKRGRKVKDISKMDKQVEENKKKTSTCKNSISGGKHREPQIVLQPQSTKQSCEPRTSTFFCSPELGPPGAVATGDRTKSVREVQASMKEVGQMFQELHQLAQTQGGTVDASAVQDAALGELSKSVGKLKSVSHSINQELQNQNELLDSLDGKLDCAPAPLSLSSRVSGALAGIALPSRARRLPEPTLATPDLDAVSKNIACNIDRVYERGERIDCLVDQSEDLANSAQQFYKASTRLKKKSCFMSAGLPLGSTVFVSALIFLINFLLMIAGQMLLIGPLFGVDNPIAFVAITAVCVLMPFICGSWILLFLTVPWLYYLISFLEVWGFGLECTENTSSMAYLCGIVWAVDVCGRVVVTLIALVCNIGAVCLFAVGPLLALGSASELQFVMACWRLFVYVCAFFSLYYLQQQVQTIGFIGAHLGFADLLAWWNNDLSCWPQLWWNVACAAVMQGAILFGAYVCWRALAWRWITRVVRFWVKYCDVSTMWIVLAGPFLGACVAAMCFFVAIAVDRQRTSFLELLFHAFSSLQKYKHKQQHNVYEEISPSDSFQKSSRERHDSNVLSKVSLKVLQKIRKEAAIVASKIFMKDLLQLATNNPSWELLLTQSLSSLEEFERTIGLPQQTASESTLQSLRKKRQDEESDPSSRLRRALVDRKSFFVHKLLLPNGALSCSPPALPIVALFTLCAVIRGVEGIFNSEALSKNKKREVEQHLANCLISEKDDEVAEQFGQADAAQRQVVRLVEPLLRTTSPSGLSFDEVRLLCHAIEIRCRAAAGFDVGEELLFHGAACDRGVAEAWLEHLREKEKEHGKNSKDVFYILSLKTEVDA